MNRYGFNFQWMYVYEQGKSPEKADTRALDFMKTCGLDFARFASDYRFWTNGHDYSDINKNAFRHIENYLEECSRRGIHMSFNMHRVPGYCINQPEIEKHNLWTDRKAYDGFIYQWKTFAEHFKGIDSSLLSFDLMNEPPNIGQYGLTRKYHEKLIRDTAAAIREADPDREIVIDGLGGGNIPMPELADLELIQSGRGYQPMIITHYDASWCPDTKGKSFQDYPGAEYDDKKWDINTLRQHYKPWKDLEKQNVKVHIGEFGCFNSVPNDTALRWFSDLFTVYKENNWGYSLWNFEGPFGIVSHGRPGTEYTRMDGFDIDKKLLDMFLEGRR